MTTSSRTSGSQSPSNNGFGELDQATRGKPLSQTLQDLKQFYQSKLLEECLPFWLENCVDKEHGGFFTSLNRDGTVIDTDKAVWQQGRFTWLLGELFNDPRFSKWEGREDWRSNAIHGAEFLEESCIDPDDGRFWFLTDQQGDPLRKRRYSFSESFAAIAFGELAQMTGEDRYKILARKAFDAFLKSNRQTVNPKFTDTRPMVSLGFPMIAMVTAQQLRESIALESANEEIESAIESISKLFVKPDLKCVMENVAPNGDIVDHFDGRMLNPGHAIEAAWFLMEEGRIQKEIAWIELGCQMLEWMLERGWDDEFGGLLYFVDVHSLPVQEYWHDMKFWWPHNEAIIASLLAYELTKNQKYLEMHQRIHQWAFDHFADPEFGEWFGYLHRDGRLSVPLKGNHWKGPFHYPRMLLQCIRIIDRISPE